MLRTWEIIFPREKLVNWLFNTRWWALETYVGVTLYPFPFGRFYLGICMYACMHVKTINEKPAHEARYGSARLQSLQRQKLVNLWVRGRLYRKVWWEERERENDIIYDNLKKKFLKNLPSKWNVMVSFSLSSWTNHNNYGRENMKGLTNLPEV